MLPILGKAQSATAVVAITAIRWQSLKLEGWNYRFCGKEDAYDIIETLNTDTTTESPVAIEVTNSVGNENLKIRLHEAVFIFGDAGLLCVSSQKGRKQIIICKAVAETKSIAACVQIQE